MHTWKKCTACLATLAAMVLVGTPVASAEDLDYSELLSRIEALESELVDQRMDFASFESEGGFQKDACDGCGQGAADCCCDRAGAYVNYELTVLRPYVSDVNIPFGFDNEYGFGHRLALGYQDCSGLGARLRYWTYNHGHDLVPPVVAFVFDMDVIDLEATLYERLWNWDLLVAGGARYGRLGVSLLGAETYFEGTGPTVAIEGLREVGCRGLYLVGNFRSSLLIGEIRRPVLPRIDDEIAVVLENQLGAGWSREVGRGVLDLRMVWETQFWLNDTFADSANGFGSNLAFSGLTVATELRF